MPAQKGGGSVGQSLKYVDVTAPEQTAGAGSNVLVERGLIARPAISMRGGSTRKKRGGFYPSVMKGIINAGMVTGPLVAMTARRMMSRKSRKGGGKKGEVWKRNKNEAKSILEHYGKPSAGNIQAFAIEKRRGTGPAEEYIESFKKRKQEKAEKDEAIKQAKLQVKLEKKAVRNAEREKTKRNKDAAKAAAKAMKAATKKNKPVKAVKPKATKAVKPASPKLSPANNAFWNDLFGKNAPKVSAENKALWESLLNNAPKAASLKAASPKAVAAVEAKVKTPKKAKAKKTATVAAAASASANVSAVKVKTVKTAKVKKTATVAANANAVPVSAAKPKTAKVKKTATVAANANAVAVAVTAAKAKTAKVKRTAPASEKFEQYSKNLRDARTYLGTIGAPTGPNMSGYVKTKRAGDEAALRSWIENFKTRRPLSMATKKAAKAKTKAATPKVKSKALTAVKEENEENEMQGYSENFEPENE